MKHLPEMKFRLKSSQASPLLKFKFIHVHLIFSNFSAGCFEFPNRCSFYFKDKHRFKFKTFSRKFDLNFAGFQFSSLAWKELRIDKKDPFDLSMYFYNECLWMSNFKPLERLTSLKIIEWLNPWKSTP